jgi:hypothetical protein
LGSIEETWPKHSILVIGENLRPHEPALTTTGSRTSRSTAFASVLPSACTGTTASSTTNLLGDTNPAGRTTFNSDRHAEIKCEPDILSEGLDSNKIITLSKLNPVSGAWSTSLKLYSKEDTTTWIDSCKLILGVKLC